MATSIMLAGDKKCVNKRKHDTSWSSEIIRCSQVLHFWSINMSMLKGRKGSTTVLNALGTKIGVVHHEEMLLEEAEIRRKEARKSIKEVVVKAKQIRISELERSVEAHAESDN